MGAGSARHVAAAAALLVLAASATVCAAQQLRRNYYAGVCPNVEAIVRDAVTRKFRQTFITVGATVHLFFHDCFVDGCDASVVVASTANNTAEKDHPINLSLAGDGFDTVIRAKAAVDAVPRCRNRVSCADILAMATRDVIALAGGPSYAVELGRLDGLSSTASSVNGKLAPPSFNLDQLTALFATNGLSQADMIALSAGHTVGFAHCNTFSGRIRGPTLDPTLNSTYASQLRAWCPPNVDQRLAVSMDPVTPRDFDNQFFKNLQVGKGLLASDQVLYSDPRSRPTVDVWAQSSVAFNQAFVAAITKMGRIGIKTRAQGNIRRNCAVLN
ncbi:peroxidase 51-like isoform X2 [Phragmites australis]|uniref:peroxidase 51-like isoform X2 n=1 Tax=Phragmites australis TaxID=29695 RepID=UPI002D76BDCC|nr:peroxidase 51-like isoform X2 [Phragmites australis]